MKKIRLLFLSLSVAALAGCTADMDKFTERLDDLEARVAVLETLCAQMNEDISSMRTVISALEDGLYITDVKNVSDGYRIEFSDGETITIRHGEDGEDGVPGTPGADGQDGYTPVIGVRMDTDGIYYWTLDGEWLLDDQGNKMRVTGENGKDGADGKDGVTPVIGVAQGEDGIYYWTINGEWLIDENGNKVQAQYLGGADSEGLIEDIVVDDMGITFILSDGSELYIPLYEAITITFDAEDLLVMEPGSERDIHYTIESRLEDIRIEVLSSSDIRARVVPTDAFTGVINIRTGSSLDEYSKVVVFATNGEKMLMRTIIFEEAGLEIQNEAVKQVPEEGGEISLEFLSNVETQVIIPENAQDWISLVPATKAMEYNAVTLQIEPNPGYYRSAEVSISSLGTSLSLTYTIEQNGEMGVDIDPEAVPEDEIWYVTEKGILACDFDEFEMSHGYIPFDKEIVSHTYAGGLGKIKFEGPVTLVKQLAFSDINNSCEMLKEIFLPDCVRVIERMAFGRQQIDVFKVPSSLETVDYEAFLGAKIKKFVGDNTLPDGEGILVGGALMALNYDENATELIIPGDVLEISTALVCTNLQNFSLRPNMKRLILSEGIKKIGNNAFQYCNNLESVYLPASLEEMGTYIFRECPNIKEFIGPSRYVSSDNKCLLDIIVVNGVEKYGIAYAAKIDLPADYIIPEGIVSISPCAFENCRDLRSVTLPQSLLLIQAGGEIFRNCPNFEFIYGNYASADNKCAIVHNEVWCDGNAMLAFAGKGIVAYETSDVKWLGDYLFAYQASLEKIVVNDEVTNIGNHCFAFSPNLKSIVLPKNLKELRYDPFIGSNNLEEVYVRSIVPPTIYEGITQTDYTSLRIYVPAQSLELYLNDAVWSAYSKYIVGYEYDDIDSYYTSTDYSADGTYELLQQATVGNGIDVVLMGDAYSDRLIADGTYRSVMENTMEQFFSEEPYKSFREYFNVYMVNVISPNEVYEPNSRTALSTWFGDGTSVGGDDQTVFSYALNAISADRMDEALIVVMMNRDYYAGTCWMYYPESGDYGNGVSVAYFPTSSDEATFRGLILHEAGGHGFAKLADEYAYEEYGQVPSDEITDCQNLWDFGWYPNIDFTSDPALVNWSEFIADARYQYDGLGVFEGGYTYWTGVWRPTENSIMRYNEGGFNAPSREAIYTRINKLAFGESWQYDYEDFVSYDAVNRRSEPATAPSSVLQRHEPTAPPVIVRKTWREALESSGQPEAHLKSR